ncbi:uncharacterized protein H6S33_000131 [Morchella sextelata]|uniref:uncharacterized protein n=1 Tax=Morchella sextelata TaxID=1174677 RepID=UPI001D04B5A3|nr:uncharacterized protein H6S33_000131 [Morchella sextelata]KAH0614495.1 hypothetical protein H6S33_000131 [Morchella sextelata]
MLRPSQTDYLSMTTQNSGARSFLYKETEDVEKRKEEADEVLKFEKAGGTIATLPQKVLLELELTMFDSGRVSSSVFSSIS